MTWEETDNKDPSPDCGTRRTDRKQIDKLISAR